jgi:hypothetical protein
MLAASATWATLPASEFLVVVQQIAPAAEKAAGALSRTFPD